VLLQLFVALLRMLALPGLCASLSQELSVSNMLNAFAAIAIAKAWSNWDVLLNSGGQPVQQHRLP